jgi:diacylglycerol kinase family enzyme
VRTAALIVNPRASRVTPALTERVLAELAQAGPVEKLVTERPMHGSELAEQLRRSVDEVYVLSGDGGYNEVVNGLVPGQPVGFLPGGATNVLPRALGLPRDAIVCARRLARSRNRRRIALGVVEFPDPASGSSVRRRFTFCAGLGLDAEVVRAVEARGRASGKRPGDLAFASELLRIVRHRGWRLEPVLQVEGHGRAAFAVAANCDPYTYAGPFPVHAAPDATFEGGIDVVGPRALDGRGLARLAWSVLAHPTHPRSAHFVYVHDADRVAIRCDRPAPLQADGEDLGDVASVILESEREALNVIV